MIHRAPSCKASRCCSGRVCAASDIRYFCHGTTVGTNALLEDKGVKTGLLVTEGFRAIYEVGEQARPYGPAIFDVMYDKPHAARPGEPHRRGEGARRFSRRGAACRSTRRRCGRRSRELKAQRRRVDRRVPAVFLPASRARDARARRSFVEEMPGLPAFRSRREVLPQIREYYRLSTTVINAYLQPILARYIGKLDRRLRRPGSRRGRNTSCSRTAAWRRSRPPRARRWRPCCRGRPAASPPAPMPAA